MSGKVIPLPSIFNPPGFRDDLERRASVAERLRGRAEEVADSTTFIARCPLGPQQQVMYLHGPHPLPTAAPVLVFQVVWFGGNRSPWPHEENEEIAPPAVKTDTMLGRTAIWIFGPAPAEAVAFLRRAWNLEPPPPPPLKDLTNRED